MTLHTQIQTILFSFCFGILFSLFLTINYKFLYESKKITKILFSCLIVILALLFYFYGLLKINYGVIHIYGILSIIVGFILESCIGIKIRKLFYKKKKK